jgi:hypothetical protein
MSSLFKFILTLCFALSCVGYSAPDADAATGCPAINLASERSKLQKLLTSKGVAKDERSFLLEGADKRLKELQSRSLNARGAQCGIDTVRGMVLGCMNDGLPSLLSSTPADRKASEAVWGRAGLSARGAAFVGIFHSCRAVAMDILLK